MTISYSFKALRGYIDINIYIYIYIYITSDRTIIQFKLKKVVSS